MVRHKHSGLKRLGGDMHKPTGGVPKLGGSFGHMGGGIPRLGGNISKPHGGLSKPKGFGMPTMHAPKMRRHK